MEASSPPKSSFIKFYLFDKNVTFLGKIQNRGIPRTFNRPVQVDSTTEEAREYHQELLYPKV